MRIHKLFPTIITLLHTFSFYSQVDKTNELECKRFKFLAQEERKATGLDTALKVKLMHYKSEFTYLIKGESFCGNYSKNNYYQIIRSGQDVRKLEKDIKTKALYTDTLFAILIKIDSLIGLLEV